MNIFKHILPQWKEYEVLDLRTGLKHKVSAVCYQNAVIAVATANGQGDCDLHVGQYTYSVGDFCILKQ